MNSSCQDRLKSYFESKREEAVILLSRLIEFQSTLGREHEVQAHLYKYLHDSGMNVERAPVADNITLDPDYTLVPGHTTYQGRPNLLVNIEGNGVGRSVILNSHCDVVPAPVSMFCAKIEHDSVFGRGACDAKGQVVTILMVLHALKDLGIQLSGDLQAQFVIEEEAGGNGALAAVLDGIQADCAVILEPTSLQMHPANRGAVWYKLTVKGKSVHMGKYWQGVSAIEQMIELIGILKKYELKLRAESTGNPLFPHDPNPVNVNIGQIHGGDWPATVAGECSIEGGIAFLPNKDIPTIHKELLEMIEQNASEWLKDNYTFEFGRLHNEAFETPVDHPSVPCFSEAVQDVLGNQPVIGWIASCDARLFARRGKMPTITFGPGELGVAHSLSELIKIGDIMQAAEVLTRFVINWCGASDENELGETECL